MIFSAGKLAKPGHGDSFITTAVVAGIMRIERETEHPA
jgi:hypothetical protein